MTMSAESSLKGRERLFPRTRPEEQAFCDRISAPWLVSRPMIPAYAHIGKEPEMPPASAPEVERRDAGPLLHAGEGLAQEPDKVLVRIQ